MKTKLSLTIAEAKKYITTNYGSPRHDISKLVRACRTVGTETEIDPRALFFLVIENQPIDGCYTHSYGFHTSNGRHLIDSINNLYYEN